MMIDVKHCSGCRDDCYNHGFMGKQQCWSRENAKLQTMYSISPNAPQDRADRFTKHRKPSCYHQDGWCWYTSLPRHLR